MKKFALVGALATLTLAATACGSDDGGGSGGSDTLTERQYVRELEKLCRQVDGDLEELGDPDSYRALVRLGEDAQEIVADGLADLEELNPPRSLQRDHEDYVASIRNTLELTADFIEAAEDEDDDALADVQDDLQAEKAERDEIAAAIGADDCVDESTDDPGEPGGDPTTTTEPDATTVPDDPTTTTEPADEPTTTTTAETIPRITVPPVDMTMPSVTEPPVVSGSEIGTIDFQDLNLPAGYTFQNVNSESLAEIQNLYAQQFTGAIDAIGGAVATDDATGESFSAFVFFWFESLADTGNGIAFVDDLVADDEVLDWSEVVTPGGLLGDRLVYVDDTEALIVWGGKTAIVLFGDVGSEAALANLVDALAGT